MNVLVLVYYAAAVAAVTVLLVRRARVRRGPGGPVHDPYEAAFLGGGPVRVVDTALAALHADGRIAIGGPGVVAVVHPLAHDPVERAVLDTHAAAPHGALHHLRLAVLPHPAVQGIGDALAARGLVPPPAAVRSLRRWCAGVGITVLLLAPVSVIVTVGDLVTREGPVVPFVIKVLPALLGAGVTALVCGATAGSRLTGAGAAALAAYRRHYGGLADTRLLVALYGVRALPDPGVREQLLAAARIRDRTRAYRSRGSAAASGEAAVWCAAEVVGGGGWGGDDGGSSGSHGSCGSSSSSCGSSSSSSCGSSSSSCGSSSSSSG